jgi:endonuclease/exonuclease/phosphatase family metal-dependent hydrolase
MKVVSWNVGSNTGYRADLTTARLAKFKADIALLQEVDSSGGTFAVFAPCTEVTSWGSAIVTDYPFQPAELEVPDELRPWLRIAAAKVVVGGIDFQIASVHPHYESVDPPLQEDRGLRRYILGGARWLWHCDVAFGILNDKLDASSRFIISGDWNTARAFQHSSVPDARFSEAFFDRARAAGWYEVALDKSGREQPTYTQRGARYQLDHLFVDARTYRALRKATVATDVLDEGLSDHAPIVADFDLGS